MRERERERMKGNFKSLTLFQTISDCKFNFDLSSVIEETARRAAIPVRTPKTSVGLETPEARDFEKKRSNRYSENSDGGSSDSSGLDVRFFYELTRLN